ncbi:MAG: ferritin family protein [Chloroflexi bacterium]|nr:ferritin family protein [Chloroflexota bacterium]
MVRISDKATSTESDIALAALEQGIIMETDGRRFYLDAEDQTSDRSGKRMFHALAEDEEEHLNILQREYASLKGGKRWLPVELARTGRISLPEFSVFPRDSETRRTIIKPDTTDADALDIAISMERKGFAAYAQAVAQIDDPGGQAIYRFLVKEEDRHLDLLQRAKEYLGGAGVSEFDDLERPFLELP